MYKVLTQNARLPVIAGNNKKDYLTYNQNHELKCSHPSLQAEFDALVVKKVLGTIVQQPNKENIVLAKDKQDKIIK